MFLFAGISRFLAINDGYLPIAAENPAAWGSSVNCRNRMDVSGVRQLVIDPSGLTRSNWPEWMSGQGRFYKIRRDGNRM